MKSFLFFSVSIAALGLGAIGCASKEATERDEQLLRTVMNEHQSEAQKCFDDALAYDPTLAGGEMKIRADQSDEGKFQNVRFISGFAGSYPIYNCLAAQIPQWSMPVTETDGPLDMIFHFKSHKHVYSPEEVDAAIKPHTKDFLDCYEKVYNEDPALGSGRAEYKFVVTRDGKVEAFREVSGFLGSREVAKCLQEKSKAWDFQPKGTPADLEWAWTFTPPVKARGSAEKSK